MTPRWCITCKAYRQPNHQHEATLWDTVSADLTGLMQPEKPEVWNLTEGERQRDVGMAQVSSHTPGSYRHAFAGVVQDFRRLNRDFTADDVIARIGLPPPPTHRNAVGALTRSIATRMGAMKVGHTKAQRTARHAGEVAVWGWRNGGAA